MILHVLLAMLAGGIQCHQQRVITSLQTVRNILRRHREVFGNDSYFFWVGTGMPGIFTLTEPRWFRLVKYRVFQSSPPKARLVVAGAPGTMRPSFLPWGSRIHMAPDP